MSPSARAAERFTAPRSKSAQISSDEKTSWSPCDQPIRISQFSQRWGQVALLAEVLDGDRIPPLAEFLATGSDDQWNVGELGRLRFQRAVERDLERRVGVVVGAADHVGDSHFEVVHHHGEVIERLPVAALDDPVPDLRGVLAALAEDQVVPAEIAALGQPQANRVRPHTGAEIEIPAAPVVGPLLASRNGRLAALLELLGRAHAAVGAPARQQALDRGSVAVRVTRSGAAGPRPSRFRAIRAPR